MNAQELRSTTALIGTAAKLSPPATSEPIISCGKCHRTIPASVVAYGAGGWQCECGGATISVSSSWAWGGSREAPVRMSPKEKRRQHQARGNRP